MKTSRSRSPILVLVAFTAVALAGCTLEGITNAFSGGDCDAFSTTYDEEFVKAGLLSTAIPDTVDGFAMGLVLNQRAVNDFFQRLGAVELPVLGESFRVLGQEVSIGIQPSIPTLGIGGQGECVDCFTAGVPFALEVGFGGERPVVGGTLTAQMPLGMRPVDDRQTSLVASFQEMEVLSLEIESGNRTVNDVFDTIEPIANRLLTDWLSTRFENARVATFDSWALGQGDVLLAGRGPFVFPETETIVIAMQSNLMLEEGTSMEVQSTLPEGADIGFVFHPNLLLSMTRRMHYEGVIPQDYDDDGQAVEAGPSTKVSFRTMSATDDGLLRTGATLYRTNNLCGTADLTAAMGLTIAPGIFEMTVQDVQIESGEGIGQLLSQDAWGTGPLVNQLLSTLEFTINYDQVFGGEAAESPEMAPFQFSIDGRGISVFFNL